MKPRKRGEPSILQDLMKGQYEFYNQHGKDPACLHVSEEAYWLILDAVYPHDSEIAVSNIPDKFLMILGTPIEETPLACSGIAFAYAMERPSHEN